MATPGTLVRDASSGSKRRGPSTRETKSRSSRNRSADCADVPLQVAHACLTGVAFDEPTKSGLLELCVLGAQSIGFELARDKVSLGDVELVGLGVAGDFDHFHAIPQGPWHGIHRVGRRDEQHARQIKWDIEVMVGEGIILRRIEHFQ